MRIAIIGIRGVPANYGGLENCAEEVGARLAARGHEVIVYCRRGAWDDAAAEYRGMKRITLPSLRTKVTDTYSHSLLSMFHVLGQKPDVILAFNPGIASLCVIPKLLGYKVVLNADGFDWRRKKWSWFARTFIHRSASLAAKLCDRLVFDCLSARDYCARRFWCARPPEYIPNGTAAEPSERPEVIRQYGLEKDGYFLFLSRIEPENLCHLVIKAFEGLDTDKRLFLAGGSRPGCRYLASLKQTADPRIVFPGPIYDPLHVKELHYGCYALVHANQAGGTSVGLLKALSSGACVLSLNTPDNAYVVRDAGLLYEPTVEDLRAKMQLLLQSGDRVAEYRRRAVERIGTEFLWDTVADRYEELFRQIADGRSVPSPRWKRRRPDAVRAAAADSTPARPPQQPHSIPQELKRIA